MRYVGLLIFFVCIPVFVAAIRANPRIRRLSWVLLGASPYIYQWAHFSVSIVSWAFWPGYVKGILVALPDLLAIGLIVSTPGRCNRYGVPIMLGCYILAAAGSMLSADLPSASFLYVWQLLRVLLVAIAVARISGGAEAPRRLVSGMCLGIIFQAFFSLDQRFLHGTIQASGTMGHQNLLGMMTHFALLLPLALILSGDRSLLFKIGVMAAMVTVALTGSRGTVGFAAGGIIVLIALSLVRRPTAKKMQTAAAGFAILLVLSPVAYLTLAHRFAASSDDGSYDERAAFRRAARTMWHDYPLGVGANEYVVTANTKGYSARAGVIWSYGSRAANVHNLYLLIAAETGWPGLIAFALLYITALGTALRAAWSRPLHRYTDLSIGVFVTLAVVGFHNIYEWIFVTEPMQYLFGITLGLAMGLGRQSGKPRRLASTGPVRRELVPA